jgi:hypothetical protein
MHKVWGTDKCPAGWGMFRRPIRSARLLGSSPTPNDQTPMKFVVFVLERFFGMTRPEAQSQMLSIHYEGRAICGTYPHEECADASPALTRINQRDNRSRLLICPVRPAGQKGYQGSARE